MVLAVADDQTPSTDEPVATDGFHIHIVTEDQMTDDDRMFTANSLDWRDPPLSLMATDKTSFGHEDAILIGNITRLERHGAEIHGWGEYITDPDAEALALIGLVLAGELTGISVDAAVTEFELEIHPDEFDETGEVLTVSPGRMLTRVTEGRILGATVVPFPAFDGPMIESIAAASATESVSTPGSVAASAAVEPPRIWFDNPELAIATPLTITDEGRVFGHIATWDQCHVGYAASCVVPPPSPSNYARFRLGEVRCDDGTRVNTGPITMGGLHADRKLGPADTMAHYEDVGTVLADVAVGEDENGIWVAGALRPTVTPEQVRAAMASTPSIDCRGYGPELDLVAVHLVNTPGFPVPRLAARLEDSLVASLIFSAPIVPPVLVPARTVASMRQLIAATVGLDHDSRRQALRELV